MKFYLCIIATILMGCRPTPSNQYTVYVNPDFGDKTEYVVEALQSWEASTNGRAQFDIKIGAVTNVDEQRCTIDIRYVSERIVQGVGTDYDTTCMFHDTTYGCTHRDSWRDNSVIFIDNDLATLDLLRVAIQHEIGHAMALQHDVVGTLMFSSNSDTLITCRDVRQWARLRHETIDCQ